MIRVPYPLLPSSRLTCLLLVSVLSLCTATFGKTRRAPAPINKTVLIKIIRAEDERRWDDDLRGLFADPNAAVRQRAALAAGRIGDERAVSDLTSLLENDPEPWVRSMAAFALGEVESIAGAPALLAALKDARDSTLQARTLEALGKIAAATPKDQEAKTEEIRNAILDALKLMAAAGARPTQMSVLLGLTAALRAKPDNAGPTVALFLDSADARIRADAGNTLARLRLKDGNAQLRKMLTADPDPIARANAARVLGAGEDKDSFNDLLDRALRDRDSRVRVSAIRALAGLKNGQAVNPLIERGDVLLKSAKRTRDKGKVGGPPTEVNELLEIATTLGRLRQHMNDERAIRWLQEIRPITVSPAPELEISMARVHPSFYLSDFGNGITARRQVQEAILLDWRRAASLAQGLGEIANLPGATRMDQAMRLQTADLLRAMLDYRNSGLNINTLVAVHSEYAVPDVLRAFAAFKPKDLADVLRKHLKEPDVIVRGTAADLLGELPPDDKNARALVDALPVALADKQLNDAGLSILDALAKQKSSRANDAIKTALDSDDHLIRRRAVALLKTNGVGDFSSRIGVVRTRNTVADYERAIGRIGKSVTAVVTTSKGSFTIDLLPAVAPLNVDNFIGLAKRGYFGGITIHRVVPNFVIQDGDPRGEGNGGPGYQIRCEINQVTYDRGAVGMALSGKDTGGSQWFVTHSPQPHLDGGYTVFGNVILGMNVVDGIARGDVIKSIVIREPVARRQR
jgi:cyclophilin family peptidyl-prolyl cis-trans isomerase/HEAT repeat protein